jgi:hypothetical protein
MPHCKGETWCRRNAAKCRSWAYEGWKAISTWEAPTGYSIASGLMHIPLYCSFKLATCTAHSQTQTIPLSCSPLRTPTVYISHHIPAPRFQHLILVFHSIQNGSSHICSFWVRCRSTLECHQVIIVRNIGCCPCAVRPCPQCEFERQPCCCC